MTKDRASEKQSGGLEEWSRAMRNHGFSTVYSNRTMAKRYQDLDRLGLVNSTYINTSLEEFNRHSEELLAPFIRQGMKKLFASIQAGEYGDGKGFRGKNLTLDELVAQAKKFEKQNSEGFLRSKFSVCAVPSIDADFSGNITVNTDGSLTAEFMAGTQQITRKGGMAQYRAWTPEFQEKFLRFSTEDEKFRQSMKRVVEALPREEAGDFGAERYVQGYYEVVVGRIHGTSTPAISFFDYRKDRDFLVR